MLEAQQEDWPWMPIARGELGVHEIPGQANNPRIMEYQATTTLPANMRCDETAWCSCLVNFCVTKSGHKGTNRANARSWLEWGRPIETPEPGCIAVFMRGDHPAQGHVGFVVGVVGDDLLILGGNQGNAVSIHRYPRSRLLGLRLPTA